MKFIKKQYFLIAIFFYIGIGTGMAQLTDMVFFTTGWPYGSLTLSNKLYGLTSEGGLYDKGMIFSIDTTALNFKVLHNFNETLGAGPTGSLTLSGSKFFGMTNTGGPCGPNGEGVIFTMDTNGNNYKVIFNFCTTNGYFPNGDLTLIGGKLYGMASDGGAYTYGVIFSVDTNGSNYRVLLSFNGTDGAAPRGDLTLTGNKFYGMTSNGGTVYKGNIFAIDTDGNNYRNLFQFNGTNGEYPYSSLTLSGHKLFGVTSAGGTHTYGNIFSIDTDGSNYTILHNFNGSDGKSPWATLNLTGGVLYGMAPGGGLYNQGVVFSIDTNGANFSVLCNFNGIDGGAGYGGLTITGDVFYGLTYYGWDAYHGLAFKFYDTVLQLAITGVNVTCTGASNGYAIVNVGGGNEPYTYSWSPISGSSNTVSSLSAGTYTVTVKDIHGYIGTDFVTIGPPTPLVVSDSVIANVLCKGGINGKALAKVSGGTSPYTYSWAPISGSSNTVSGLSAGTYTVTVKDSCGSSASANVMITQPNQISVTVNILSNVLCNGGNSGSASATVSGGTLPYTYLWGGGSTTNPATSLSAGVFILKVSDANGCTTSASYSITEPASISIFANVTANVLCNGGSNGSASVNVSGGTSPYTYLWNNSQTTANSSGLNAGIYTVKVQDANGCTSSATLSISQPAAINITPNSTPDDGSGDGAAWANVSGGTNPYSYLWNPGGNTTSSINNKAAGNYCCSVTDANGCTATSCVTIVSTAGIGNISTDSKGIIIYPNPTNGQFTIQSSVTGQMSVEIYNMLGQKVYSKFNTQNPTLVIDLNSHPDGIYFYRAVTNNGSVIGEGKLIIAK